MANDEKRNSPEHDGDGALRLVDAAGSPWELGILADHALVPTSADEDTQFLRLLQDENDHDQNDGDQANLASARADAAGNSATLRGRHPVVCELDAGPVPSLVPGIAVDAEPLPFSRTPATTNS